MGVHCIDEMPIEILKDYIDWTPFFHAWEFKGIYQSILSDPKKGIEARKVYEDAMPQLKSIIGLKSLTANMADQKGDMSNKDLKALSQLQANQELAKTDPQYLELAKIQKLLVDHGTKLDVIAGASASTAIDTKKQNKPDNPAL